MLKIYKDKVVIEGHEQTKEQCETMTLLANALKDSKDFKVVDYKNGYAEFEKVGNTNELKFVATTDWNILVNGESLIIKGVSILTKDEERQWGYRENLILNSSYYTIVNEKVQWKDGNILQYNNVDVLSTDIIIVNGVYTTKQSGGGSSMKSVDLTTLSGWNDLAGGTHNITVVAKGTGYRDSEESDSVQVTKSSGAVTHTLTWNGSPFEIKVNGTIVKQELDINGSYTFNEGDIITIDNRTSVGQITINGVAYTSETTLSILGENITVEGKFPGTSDYVITINT